MIMGYGWQGGPGQLQEDIFKGLWGQAFLAVVPAGPLGRLVGGYTMNRFKCPAEIWARRRD